MNSPSNWMQQAIDLAVKNIRDGLGGPFGAVVVRNGVLVGSGANSVTSSNDPTAHAEVMAIRSACKTLKTFYLGGCEIYTSCEPCPMCLGAIYWARLEKIYYACTREDAAMAGFDDAHIYSEVGVPVADRKIPCEELLRDQSGEAFRVWKETMNRVPY